MYDEEFESEDPENFEPKNYKEFRRQIMRAIEDIEIEEGEDEGYPSALFLVTREGESAVIYLKDLVDEEDEENIDLGYIIGYALPTIVKKENSRFFAFVFSGEKASASEPTANIVVMLSGSMQETDMAFSEYTFENGIAVMEPWEKDKVLQYPELVAPFRRAITPQG